jgi:hypothetical protein
MEQKEAMHQFAILHPALFTGIATSGLASHREA